MASNQELNVNGMKIKVGAVKRTVTRTQQALYPMNQRAQMRPKDLAELFDNATRTTQTRYSVLDVKIQDPEKLADTYDLEMANTRLASQHLKYDMNVVFDILLPDPTDPGNFSKFTSVNLYTDYARVTKAQVAVSNEWYSTMPEAPQDEWLLQNLKLTHEHLVNNTEEELVTKVNETYFTYPPDQRGGPLFFKIMMDMLQNNSDEAADYLTNVVKNLNIATFDGENIDKVVSLIRGAVKRLRNLKTRTGRDALPSDFADSLMKIFQTSSVEPFNLMFKHIHLQYEMESMRDPNATLPSIDDLLSFAEVKFRKLSSTDDWSGVKTKAHETAFVVHAKGPTCFNCGGPHTLRDCTKPLDDSRIKANKQAFWDKSKKDKPSSPTKSNDKGGSKKKASIEFAPPTAEEKKNRSNRTIDGVLNFYDYKKKRWKPVPNANNATSTTPNASPTTQAAVAPVSSLSTTSQVQDVALANATQAMSIVMRNLMDSYK